MSTLSLLHPPWKAWYKTARWQRLRLAVFKRDCYTCRCGCGMTEADTSLLVCDHRIPHRGNEHLFWDESNLQTLLKSCHDRDKQKTEQASLYTRGVAAAHQDATLGFSAGAVSRG